MISVNIEGMIDAVRRLDSLTPKLRKQIYRKAARQLVKSSKDRIDSQTDLDGQPFKPAADGSRRKLLVGKSGKPGVRRLLSVLSATDSSAEIGWKNPFFGSIAFKQQFGFSEPTKARNRKKEVDYSAPANRQQAKALIDAGYKKRRPRGGYKTPSIRWITQNITTGQAGLILRILQGPKVSTGTTTVPARSFLGVTPADLNALEDLLNESINEVLSA